MVLELERTPDILRSMRSVFGFTGTLIGFDSRENEVVLVFPDHVEYLEMDTKVHIAMHIIEHATQS